jgi:hypothetical protein
MKIFVYLISFLLFFQIIAFSQQSSGGDVVEVPFTFDYDEIITDVKFRNNTSLNMALSLQRPSAIDISVPEIQEKSKSAFLYKKGVTDVYTPFSFFSDLSIGSFKIPILKMYWGIEPITEIKVQQNIRGILGISFFDNKVIQIDYQRNRLRLFKNNSYRELFKDNLINNSKAIVKLNVFIKSPPDETSYVTTEEVFVDGKKSKVLISIDSAYSAPEDKKVDFRNVKIGEIEVANAPILKSDSKKYDYILNNDFLKKFVVTLNFKNNKLRIDKRQ